MTDWAKLLDLPQGDFAVLERGLIIVPVDETLVDTGGNAQYPSMYD